MPPATLLVAGVGRALGEFALVWIEEPLDAELARSLTTQVVDEVLTAVAAARTDIFRSPIGSHVKEGAARALTGRAFPPRRKPSALARMADLASSPESRCRWCPRMW